MKVSTKEDRKAIITIIKNEGYTISEYSKRIEDKNLSTKLKQAYEASTSNHKLDKEFQTLYEEVKAREISKKDIKDSENYVEISYERDANNKIIRYYYKIFKRRRPTLEGTLSREEMSTMIRLYTKEGCNLTAAHVSREFSRFSVHDQKRIFSAFAIYKDSCPFAPHDIEEKTVDELREIQIREKENDFMRKAEEDRIKNNEKLLRKYAQENIELKEQLKSLTNFNINLEHIPPYIIQNLDEECTTAINLYLSDVHLGSYTESGALYDTNRDYGFEEAKRRLQEVINKLCDLRTTFDVLNLCLMGDNIDCCGHVGYTSRLDHLMPENMDAKDQFNKFIELYDWFIRTLAENNIFDKKINVYSVPTGNHAGTYEYALNKTLKYYTEARFPDINFTLFENFFGIFEQNGITFLLTHGKEEKFMRKGMPLNLDDKSKIKIYEWLDDNKIYGDNIHIIKGDLHSNNINSCKKFTYRNVLSLYGSSDHCDYNYSRNSYGLSYDLILNNNVISGTFENL